MAHGLGVVMRTLDRHELITLDAQVVIMRRRNTMTKNLADVAVAIVKRPLGNSDAPGGVLAWQNPEGADILLTAVSARVTQAPADGSVSTIPAGRGATATTDVGDPFAPYLGFGGLNMADADPSFAHPILTTVVVLPAGHYVLMQRPWPDVEGSGPPPSSVANSNFIQLGGIYHDTAADTYHRCTSREIDDPPGSGLTSYTWEAVPFSLAGLAGYAYVYYHVA